MRPAPHLSFWLSLIVALSFQVFALPEGIAAARPLWLPLVLGYWALMEPRAPVLAAAFLFGLLEDVLLSTPLGQHSLGLVIVVFLVARMRSLFGLFPLWQAMLGLVPIWALYTLALFWIDGVSRHTADPWLRWLPVLSTSLFWPLVYVVLEGTRQRRRGDD